MHTLDPLWLILAGFGGGLAGSIAGLASLVSYPALLAVGLKPVTANVSNTVALTASSAGAVSGSRPELARPQPGLLRLCAIAVAGGLTGGAILLATPAGAFTLVVPWLIAVASLAILVERAPTAAIHHPGWEVSVGTFVIAVYGGYFGAGAGVMLLALLLYVTTESLPRSNAVKNVLLGLANAVAAVAFIAFGHVRWSAAIPLAAGFLVGGRLGPVVVRRAPTRPLRVLIAVAGLGLAVHLALGAYG